MDVARAVRRDDDDRRLVRANRAELGNGDLKIREELQQVPFELFVGAIDLVDEQHGRTLARLLDGAQQRPLDQKRLREQLARRGGAIDLACRFDHPDLEQLPRVVPFVHRLADVESFVTLQANQRRLQRGGEDLGDLGLADTRFAFEKERTLQPQREIDGNGEPPLGDVLLAGEGLLQRVNRRRDAERRPAHARPARAAAAAIARLT